MWWNSVQQHGRTVWHSLVEQCGTAWWNTGTVWQSVVVQCRRVWWNSETVWENSLKWHGGTLEQYGGSV